MYICREMRDIMMFLMTLALCVDKTKSILLHITYHIHKSMINNIIISSGAGLGAIIFHKLDIQSLLHMLHMYQALPVP